MKSESLCCFCTQSPLDLDIVRAEVGRDEEGGTQGWMLGKHHCQRFLLVFPSPALNDIFPRSLNCITKTVWESQFNLGWCWLYHFSIGIHSAIERLGSKFNDLQGGLVSDVLFITFSSYKTFSGVSCSADQS